MNKTKQHIFLLGPPAVGKLTIGKLLSKKTNFPLFDNAKTVDIASLLFPYGTDKYCCFRDDLRFLFYKKVIDSNVSGLISTYCYRHPDNVKYLLKVSNFLSKCNWNTVFVVLFANASVLKKRVKSKERKNKNTFYNENQIDKWILSNPKYRQIKLRNYIGIDNSDLTTTATANLILKKMEEFNGTKRATETSIPLDTQR